MYCYDLGLASELFSFLRYLRAAMLLQKEGVVTSVHDAVFRGDPILERKDEPQLWLFTSYRAYNPIGIQ